MGKKNSKINDGYADFVNPQHKEAFVKNYEEFLGAITVLKNHQASILSTINNENMSDHFEKIDQYADLLNSQIANLKYYIIRQGIEARDNANLLLAQDLHIKAKNFYSNEVMIGINLEAFSFYNLAEVQYKLKNYTDAETNFQRAIQVNEEALGFDNYYTISYRCMLSGLYADIFQLEKAENLCVSQIKIIKAITTEPKFQELFNDFRDLFLEISKQKGLSIQEAEAKFTTLYDGA